LGDAICSSCSAWRSRQSPARAGAVKARLGRILESIDHFHEAALRLKPELKGAADNLRRAQAQLGSQK